MSTDIQHRPTTHEDDETSGRRAARLRRERRRRTRRRLVAGVGLLAIAAVAALTTAVLTAPTPEGEVAPRGGAQAPAGPEQRTLLLVRQSDDDRPADGVTLLAAGSPEVPAVVVFMPVGTLVDIPGVGLDRLGFAAQYGDAGLVEAALENTLGVAVDEVATVTDSGLGSFLGRTGGFHIEVPSRLVVREDDGTADVRFEAGQQFLDGRQLAELWGFTSTGEDELASFPRQQLVLDQLLEHSLDPAARQRLLAGGAPQLRTEADPEWLDRLFIDLARARAEDRLRYLLLPVEPFGGPGPDGRATFRMQEADARRLVDEWLVASVPSGGGSQALRVQVLNGVGIPGIGQEIDRRLDRGSFRIVLSDNARSFDFPTTRIVVYDESDRSLDAARLVQSKLGVGTIEVSRQPQSVVDLTIVVGADFLDEVPHLIEDAGDDTPSEEQS